jgi:quercetin dioxygenase-like cupin family protein
VCGRTAEGSWGILADGPPLQVVPFGRVGETLTYLWSAPRLALETTDLTAPPGSARPVGLHTGETQFSICQFAPAPAPGWWHRNNTIDYQYVISGAILLQLENGSETTLEAGDTNIQIGGTHRWWNHRDAPCVMAIVQIGVDGGGLRPYNEKNAGVRP